MQTINVVAAIIKSGNKVFITKRGHGEFKGKWEFPGGKIELRETAEEAIVREIKEELKSTIKVIKYFGEINDTHGDKIFNVKFYICELVDGDLELTEHLASKWIESKNIIQSDFLESDREILEKLKVDKKFELN